MHRQVWHRVRIATAALLCATPLALAASARAEQQVTITSAGFSPNRLGVPVNAFGSATISSTVSRVPSPITHVNVYGPPGVTLDLHGTGTCSAAALNRTLDTKVCPASSRAGFGGGIGVYELAHEIIEEKYTLDFFLSDNRPGHTALVIFLNGATPVSVQVVFTAVVIHSPKPYGLGLSIDVPIIKVLPEASDASAKTSFLTLGAKNVAYYRRVHGRRKLVHVRGIVSPRTCPRGGWPVASQFSFQDGSTVLATSAIPCPARR
jgi:hypothetical protein